MGRSGVLLGRPRFLDPARPRHPEALPGVTMNRTEKLSRFLDEFNEKLLQQPWSERLILAALSWMTIAYAVRVLIDLL